MDPNHQEQTFDTCGHHLTKAECDAYSDAQTGLTTGSVAETDPSKPHGCYKVGDTTTYKFNDDKSGTAKCSATEICICECLILVPYSLARLGPHNLISVWMPNMMNQHLRDHFGFP